LLLKWLDSRPDQSRCEWAIDPDRLLDWHEPKVVSRSGRMWYRVLYSGDDVAFRRSCRTTFEQAAKAGQPVLLVITRGSANPEPVDISHICDILGRAEGDPLDLSLVAFFKAIFPKVNPPQDALREHKDEFLECVPGLHRAYGEFKHRWGEPDNWSRGQLLSMILLARHPQFRLDEVYCDDPNVNDFLVHACRLVMSPALSDRDYPLVSQLMRESMSMQVQTGGVDGWLGADPNDLAGYLVLRDFAESQGLQNPATQLLGKFSFRLDTEALEPRVVPVIATLRRDREAWEQVNLRAAQFCRERNAAKVLDLLPPGPQPLVQAMLTPKTSPVLLRDILFRLLREFVANPTPESLAWVEKLGSHSLLARRDLTPVEQEGAAILECIIRIHRVEKHLEAGSTTPASMQGLLACYCAGAHLLELDVSEAYKLAEHVTDQVAREGIESYFHELPRGLKHRVRTYLDTLDAMLAKFIAEDPQTYGGSGPCSATRIMAQTVATYMPGEKEGRVWVLIFDGMRFDTWSRIVRPLMVDHFEVIEGLDRPYLSVLPSRTYEARRSLLAGRPPGSWKGPAGKPATDERQLAAKSMGLSELHLDEIRLLLEAQTTESRRKLGFKDLHASRYNVLVYPISDDLAHLQTDTLAAINAKVRREMVGDREQYLRGILDDLLTRISASDVVLVTSDHGFIELPPYAAVEFTAAEAAAAGRSLEEAVHYRCLENIEREGLAGVVRVQWDERTRFVLPVGSLWFRREGGRTARYAHGGVSLAEMVVPGCLMRRITEKTARIEVEDLPQVLDIPEDQSITFSFALANVGNTDLDAELAVSTNIGEHLLSKTCHLHAGAKQRFEVEVVGRFAVDASGASQPERTTRSVSVIVRHTDALGRMSEPPNGRLIVPVSVIPKAMKIETDALKDFDNI